MHYRHPSGDAWCGARKQSVSISLPEVTCTECLKRAVASLEMQLASSRRPPSVVGMVPVKILRSSAR